MNFQNALQIVKTIGEQNLPDFLALSASEQQGVLRLLGSSVAPQPMLMLAPPASQTSQEPARTRVVNRRPGTQVKTFNERPERYSHEGNFAYVKRVIRDCMEPGWRLGLTQFAIELGTPYSITSTAVTGMLANGWLTRVASGVYERTNKGASNVAEQVPPLVSSQQVDATKSEKIRSYLAALPIGKTFKAGDVAKGTGLSLRVVHNFLCRSSNMTKAMFERVAARGIYKRK